MDFFLKKEKAYTLMQTHTQAHSEIGNDKEEQILMYFEVLSEYIAYKQLSTK